MSDAPAPDNQTQLYILQNQDKLFLGKHQDWLDGREPGALYKTPHKDEAVNQRVEASARDFSQRIELVLCPANARGLPAIDPAIMPPPMKKAPPAESAPASEDHARGIDQSELQAQTTSG